MVCIELMAPVGDNSLPLEIGFMNITTWADSHETAVDKIREYTESLGWHLVSVQKGHVVNMTESMERRSWIRSKERATIPMP